MEINFNGKLPILICNNHKCNCCYKDEVKRYLDLHNMSQACLKFSIIGVALFNGLRDGSFFNSLFCL